MPLHDSLHRLDEVKKCVARCENDFKAIKSPREAYEEEVAAVKDAIRIASARVHSGATLADEPSALDDIVRLGGQLKELEINYRETIKNDQQAYEAKLEAALRKLGQEIASVMGSSMPEAQKPAQKAPAQKTPVANHNTTSRVRKEPQAETPSEDPRPRTKRRRTLREDLHGEDDFVGTAEPVQGDAPLSARKRRHKEAGGITEPTPGEVYLAYRKKSKSWSAVLILPTEDLQDIGIEGSLELFGLTECLPGCYTYNLRTKTFKWRPGYEDGGPLVANREFPVIHFDDRVFPERSAVGWIAAADLEKFDMNAHKSIVPYYRTVYKYLKKVGKVTKADAEDEDEEEDEAGHVQGQEKAQEKAQLNGSQPKKTQEKGSQGAENQGKNQAEGIQDKKNQKEDIQEEDGTTDEPQHTSTIPASPMMMCDDAEETKEPSTEQAPWNEWEQLLTEAPGETRTVAPEKTDAVAPTTTSNQVPDKTPTTAPNGPHIPEIGAQGPPPQQTNLKAGPDEAGQSSAQSHTNLEQNPTPDTVQNATASVSRDTVQEETSNSITPASKRTPSKLGRQNWMTSYNISLAMGMQDLAEAILEAMNNDPNLSETEPQEETGNEPVPSLTQTGAVESAQPVPMTTGIPTGNTYTEPVVNMSHVTQAGNVQATHNQILPTQMPTPGTQINNQAGAVTLPPSVPALNSTSQRPPPIIVDLTLSPSTDSAAASPPPLMQQLPNSIPSGQYVLPPVAWSPHPNQAVYNLPPIRTLPDGMHEPEPVQAGGTQWGPNVRRSSMPMPPPGLPQRNMPQRMASLPNIHTSTTSWQNQATSQSGISPQYARPGPSPSTPLGTIPLIQTQQSPHEMNFTNLHTWPKKLNERVARKIQENARAKNISPGIDGLRDIEGWVCPFCGRLYVRPRPFCTHLNDQHSD